MPMMLQGGPFKAPIAGLHRFTVKQYHKMIADGVLTEDDRVELLDGFLVEKMPHDPLHDGTVQLVEAAVSTLLPNGWCVRVQSAITLSGSEPEPDLALVRGNKRSYLANHPTRASFGIVIEVSNTTLDSDRVDKGAIYAEAGLPEYWIVNVVDMQIEVFQQPSGPATTPQYAVAQIYRRGDNVPFALDGQQLGSIPVNDLLP